MMEAACLESWWHERSTRDTSTASCLFHDATVAPGLQNHCLFCARQMIGVEVVTMFEVGSIGKENAFTTHIQDIGTIVDFDNGQWRVFSELGGDYYLDENMIRHKLLMWNEIHPQTKQRAKSAVQRFCSGHTVQRVKTLRGAQ